LPFLPASHWPGYGLTGTLAGALAITGILFLFGLMGVLYT